MLFYKLAQKKKKNNYLWPTLGSLTVGIATYQGLNKLLNKE